MRAGLCGRVRVAMRLLVLECGLISGGASHPCRQRSVPAVLGSGRGRSALPALLRCVGQAFWPPSPSSPFVQGGPVKWRDEPGDGVLLSCAIYRRAFQKAFAACLPYAIGLVEILPNLRLQAHLSDPDAATAPGWGRGSHRFPAARRRRPASAGNCGADIVDDFSTWIGRTEEREDRLDPARSERLAGCATTNQSAAAAVRHSQMRSVPA